LISKLFKKDETSDIGFGSSYFDYINSVFEIGEPKALQRRIKFTISNSLLNSSQVLADEDDYHDDNLIEESNFFRKRNSTRSFFRPGKGSGLAKAIAYANVSRGALNVSCLGNKMYRPCLLGWKTGSLSNVIIGVIVYHYVGVKILRGFSP
jgi:hypothetical protein